MLLAIYQAYYILAGIAGLALYPWVLGRWVQDFQNYTLRPDKAAVRALLLAGLAVVFCIAEVQFCFGRAATLFLYAAS